MKLLLATLLLAGATTILGCSSSSTDTTADPTGVQFTFTGDRNGSFSAADNDLPTAHQGTGVIAALSADSMTLTINAVSWLSSGDQANYITMNLHSDKPIKDGQEFTAAGNALAVTELTFGHIYPQTTPSDTYSGANVTIKLDKASDHQIKGTFSGLFAVSVSKTINVTNGKINVKLSS